MESSKSQDTSATDLSYDIQQYIGQLSPQEKIVLQIAQEHLASSFNIEKSIGYLEWKKSQ
jgi:hypothetical protein